MTASEPLNQLTVGQLLAIMLALGVIMTFGKNFISPLFRKWLKIDSNATKLQDLSDLPKRVSALETKSIKDFNRMNNIDEVHVLLLEATLALLKNQDSTNQETEKMEDKITGYLVGRVRN